MTDTETPRTRILIVDDQDTNIFLLVRVLARAGFTGLTTLTHQPVDFSWRRLAIWI